MTGASDDEQPSQAAEQPTAEQRLAAARHVIQGLPPTPAETLAEAVGCAVTEAVVAGELIEQLRRHGWVLVHRATGGCPPAPQEWMTEVMEAAEPGWIDPVEELNRLYRSAWTDGYRAHQAPG